MLLTDPKQSPFLCINIWCLHWYEVWANASPKALYAKQLEKHHLSTAVLYVFSAEEGNSAFVEWYDCLLDPNAAQVSCCLGPETFPASISPEAKHASHVVCCIIISNHWQLPFVLTRPWYRMSLNVPVVDMCHHVVCGQTKVKRRPCIDIVRPLKDKQTLHLLASMKREAKL